MYNFTFQLPAKASDRKQIQAVIKILITLVHSQYKKGIQLLTYWLSEYKTWDKTSKIVASNLEEIPREFANSIHAPISADKQNDLTDLSKEPSKQMLYDICSFAEEYEIPEVITHTNAVRTIPQSLNEIQEDEEIILASLYEVAKAFPKIKISVENLPVPLMSDLVTNSEMPFEYFVTSDNQIIAFARKLNNNVGFCIDMTHYLITKCHIQHLIDKYGSDPSQDILKENGCLGLTPPLAKQASLSDLILNVNKTGCEIFTLQVSGHDGSVWQPGKKVSEGVILNDENMGAEIVDSIKTSSKILEGTNISLDVDCKDYIKRPEQRTSLTYLLTELHK